VVQTDTCSQAQPRLQCRLSAEHRVIASVVFGERFTWLHPDRDCQGHSGPAVLLRPQGGHIQGWYASPVAVSLGAGSLGA
jgi:hypothetical protein